MDSAPEPPHGEGPDSWPHSCCPDPAILHLPSLGLVSKGVSRQGSVVGPLCFHTMFYFLLVSSAGFILTALSPLGSAGGGTSSVSGEPCRELT